MIRIETATRCSCGCPVTLTCEGADWIALCYDCYDGTEDASDRSHVTGYGPTPDLALWAWQDSHDLAHDVTWELVDLFGELARQVSEEAEQAQGWILSPQSPDNEPAFSLYHAGMVRLMRDELAKHATHRFQ